MAQLLFQQSPFLQSVVSDYAKWLKYRGCVEPADKREVTAFRPFDGHQGTGYRGFYVIQKGKFVLYSQLILAELDIQRYHPTEIAGVVEDLLLKGCRMAEAEWQAYWSGNLWC